MRLCSGRRVPRFFICCAAGKSPAGTDSAPMKSGWYHQGSKALQFLLFQDGSWCERIIGPDILAGEMPQSLVPAWTWQTTLLLDAQEEDWGLFSTVCVPGFEYKDYFSGDPEALLAQYPDAAERLRELGLV